MLSHPRPDRFEFRRVLGKGGVGEVLLTWDRDREAEVALKSVRLAEVKADVVVAERNGARLQMELARIAPHVPRVFEEGEDSDFYYFVMEYVAGKDLSNLLGDGPFPEGRAIHIAIQLCDFLARLHSFTSEIGGRKLLGVVHGDIKPENIRLQAEDRVRVIDFGIAKQLSLTRSYTQNVFGSLAYVSPERLEHGRVDIQSDLWATAVVLYTMVSGRAPYSGTRAEVLERQIRAHELAPLPATCSRPLQWIIQKSLSFEVDRRFATAVELRSQLEALRDKGSLGTAPEPPAYRSETTQSTQPSPPAETRRTATPPAVTAPTPPSPPPAGGSQATSKREPPPRPPSRPPVQLRPAPIKNAPTRPAVRPAAATRRARRSWPVAAVFFLLGLLALVQVFTWNEGRRLVRELQGASLSELLALWNRYQWVTRLCLFDTESVETESAVKSRLREAADEILDREHENAPRVSLEEWNTAGQYLETALEIGSEQPEEAVNLAKLPYCRGQKALAEAEALTGQEAEEKRAEAVAAFEEAARLDETWPEPFFGLARTFADGKTPDTEKFEALREEARKRGEADPRLFTMLLADAYLAAGKQLVAKAGPAGGPYDRPLLWEAFSNLEQAVRRYDDIQGYVPAKPSGSEAVDLKNGIAGILADMDSP